MVLYIWCPNCTEGKNIKAVVENDHICFICKHCGHKWDASEDIMDMFEEHLEFLSEQF